MEIADKSERRKPSGDREPTEPFAPSPERMLT